MPTPRRFSVACDGFVAEVTRRRTSRVTFRAWPDGRVTVSAPLASTKHEITALVRGRSEQIGRLLLDVAPPSEEAEQLRQAERLAPGDRAWLWAGRLPVSHRATSGPATMERQGQTLLLSGRPALLSDVLARRRAYEGLLRRELLEALPAAREMAEQAVGAVTTRWSVRRMHTRWGSCRPGTGRVSISLDLAAHDRAFLDLVALHEVAHLIASDHGPEFQAVMDRVRPGWREEQRLLDREGMRLPREAP